MADYKQYEREGGIINFNNIPNELQVTARFCAWKREPDKNGRITKVPYNPKTGGKAKSSNPDTFTDFETAVAACQPGQYDGIGIAENPARYELYYRLYTGLYGKIKAD